MVLCTCCKNCTKRHLRCHSTCEDYLEFRKNKDIENAKIHYNRTYDADIIDYHNRLYERNRRKH